MLEFIASIPTVIFVPLFTVFYSLLVFFFCRFFGFVKSCDEEIESMTHNIK